MPFGYGLWVWLKANPAAQWALAIAGAWIAFRLWLSRKIRREREDATEEAVEDVVKAIEKETENAVQRVEDERAITRSLNEQQLRDLARQSPHNRRRVQDPPAD